MSLIQQVDEDHTHISMWKWNDNMVEIELNSYKLHETEISIVW